jgi:hypothetical protein
MEFDLAMTDDLLATTRAVRKRLDLDRAVPREAITACLELAIQAPTASNSQTWRWIVIDDAGKRAAIAELYRTSFLAYNAQRKPGVDAQTERVIDSALWLAENFAKVPVFVIPCVEGRVGPDTPLPQIAAVFGSIYPAMWSFQLALRARAGLGPDHAASHSRESGRRCPRPARKRHAGCPAAGCLYSGDRFQARGAAPGQPHHALERLVSGQPAAAASA